MQQMLTIAWTQFKMIIRNKGNLFMMFAMPLMLILIFGILARSSGGAGADAGPGQPVAVADQDRSFAARRLVDALVADPSLKVQEVTAGGLDQILADKAAMAGVVIPAGYGKGLDAGKPLDVNLVSLPGSNLELNAGPAIRRALAHAAGDYQLARQITNGTTDESKLIDAYKQIAGERKQAGATVADERLKRAESRTTAGDIGLSDTTIGFTITFVMIVVFTMGAVILQERQNGTWGRLLTAPLRRVHLLAGFLTSFFIVGLFQFAVLIISTRLFFHIAWGPLPQLFVMASVFILCSTAMGLFLAGIIRTPEQQRNLSTLFVVATSMLGGAYWPLDMVSPTMQKIGYLTPQAWAVDGFREVMLRGGSWSGLVWPVAVLLALTVIFMTAGLMRVRYE